MAPSLPNDIATALSAAEHRIWQLGLINARLHCDIARQPQTRQQPTQNTTYLIQKLTLELNQHKTLLVNRHQMPPSPNQAEQTMHVDRFKIQADTNHRRQILQRNSTIVSSRKITQNAQAQLSEQLENTKQRLAALTAQFNQISTLIESEIKTRSLNGVGNILVDLKILINNLTAKQPAESKMPQLCQSKTLFSARVEPANQELDPTATKPIAEIIRNGGYPTAPITATDKYDPAATRIGKVEPLASPQPTLKSLTVKKIPAVAAGSSDLESSDDAPKPKPPAKTLEATTLAPPGADVNATVSPETIPAKKMLKSPLPKAIKLATTKTEESSQTTSNEPLKKPVATELETPALIEKLPPAVTVPALKKKLPHKKTVAPADLTPDSPPTGITAKEAAEKPKMLPLMKMSFRKPVDAPVHVSSDSETNSIAPPKTLLGSLAAVKPKADPNAPFKKTEEAVGAVTKNVDKPPPVADDVVRSNNASAPSCASILENPAPVTADSREDSDGDNPPKLLPTKQITTPSKSPPSPPSPSGAQQTAILKKPILPPKKDLPPPKKSVKKSGVGCSPSIVPKPSNDEDEDGAGGLLNAEAAKNPLPNVVCSDQNDSAKQSSKNSGNGSGSGGGTATQLRPNMEVPDTCPLVMTPVVEKFEIKKYVAKEKPDAAGDMVAALLDLTGGIQQMTFEGPPIDSYLSEEGDATGIVAWGKMAGDLISRFMPTQVAEKKVEPEKVAVEAKTEKVAVGPKTEKVAVGPKTEKVVVKAKTEKVVDTKTEKVAVEAKTEKVAVGPKTEEVVGPKTEKVVEAKTEKVVEAKTEKVVEAKTEKVAVEAKTEKVAVEAKTEKVAVGPKTEEVVGPKTEEVVGPKTEEVVGPKAEKVVVKAKTEEVVGPKAEKVVVKSKTEKVVVKAKTEEDVEAVHIKAIETALDVKGQIVVEHSLAKKVLVKKKRVIKGSDIQGDATTKSSEGAAAAGRVAPSLPPPRRPASAEEDGGILSFLDSEKIFDGLSAWVDQEPRNLEASIFSGWGGI